MPGHARLRASDADRELVAERLRQATAEGRLLASELDERLGAALSARTYGQLDALVSDLPAVREERGHAVPLWAKATLVLAAALAVLAVLALAVMVVLGLAGVWIAWVALGWVFFGRRRGCVPRVTRSRNLGMAARSAAAGASGPRVGHDPSRWL